MANIKIIDLPTGSPESTSFVEATQVDELAESGRSTVKLALNALGNYVAGQGASPLEYGDLETESTTLIGAANELHNTIGADAYDETATYNTGDYCIYGGELYKCNDDNVTGAWDATKWDATILVDELGGSGSSLVLPESIADEYDDTASYTAGDFVMYEGVLYKCNHISATGSFDPTKWDAISATDYINSVKSSLNTNISQLAGDLSDAYSSSKTYAVGDLCILGNLLYKCNTAITTPEAWTPAHWTATTVADAINEVNLELSDTVSNIEYLRSRCYLGNHSTFVVTLPDVRQGGTGFNHKLIVVGYNAFAILNCDYSGATVSVVSLGSNTITATKLANSFDVTVNLNDTSWGGIRVITLD